MKFNLEKKLILTIVPLILLLGILAIGSVFYFSKEQTVILKKESLNKIISNQAIRFENTLDFFHSLVFQVVSQEELLNYLNREDRIKQSPEVLHLLEEFRIKNEILALYLMNKEGETLVSTDESFIGKNYSFRDYFKESIGGKSFVDVSIGVTSGEFGYYFSQPVLDVDNSPIGVLVMKVNSRIIHDKLLPYLSSEKGRTFLVDRYGVIIESSDPAKRLSVLGQLTEREKSELVSSQRYPEIDFEVLGYGRLKEDLGSFDQTKIFEFHDEVDGEDELLIISKVDRYPFFLVMEEHIETFIKQPKQIGLILAGFVSAAALLAALIIFFVIRSFIKPIDKLKDFATSVARGDEAANLKLNIETGDEIEDLAKSFNVMIQKIQESRRDIDKKVSKQTKKIVKQQKYQEEQNDAILNILEDVEDDKKQIEYLARDLEKFKLAVDCASDQIVITDPDGKIVYANEACEKNTGFNSKEVIGKKAGVKENWGGIMDAGFYKNLWKTIKDNKKVFSGEITNRRKDGTEYQALVSISPVLNKKNQVVFFVAIEKDVTKEKEIDKAKTEFVSLASHQLRTPLTAINWYSEMLLSENFGKLSGRQKDFLGEIYKGNRRMVDLVNALLNVSRLELGTFSVDPKPTNIAKLSRTVIKELDSQIGYKKLKIEQVYDSKLKNVSVDPNLMTIIFQNLLSNAVKYTPEKGKIRISIKRTQKNFEIEVADNGMGIPRHQQDKIFNKLFRADNVRQKDTEGTGLGLYIIKSILDATGGEIEFDSFLNKGTTFVIKMPLAGMAAKMGNKKIE